MSAELWGALLSGVMLACGLLLILWRVPMLSRARLVQRIAPQVRGLERGVHVDARGRTALGPVHQEQSVWSVGKALAFSFLQKVLPDTQDLASRLRRAGSSLGVMEFRSRQVLWAVAVFLLGAAFFTVMATQRAVNPVAALCASFALGLCTFLAYDWWLSQRITRREKRILAEFPTIAELMAISVGAGESVPGSIERISRSAQGEMASICTAIMRETGQGTPLPDALNIMRRTSQLPVIERFVEGLIVALERGTPLAEVLRAQAQDARDFATRDLIESAGKREIAMMIPVVFGILPLTVIFAVYPGLSLLKMGY